MVICKGKKSRKKTAKGRTQNWRSRTGIKLHKFDYAVNALNLLNCFPRASDTLPKFISNTSKSWPSYSL